MTNDTPTTLYRLFDAAGDLLYVGIAGNPGRRFEQHKKDKPWWGEVASIRLEHFLERRAAEIAEMKAIKGEDPRYNIAGKVRAVAVNVAWDRLVRLEPRVLVLEEMAKAVRRGEYGPGCMCAWWYGQPGFRSMVCELVGHRVSRRVRLTHPHLDRIDHAWLASSEPYDLVYERLWDLMPFCDPCERTRPHAFRDLVMVDHPCAGLPWCRGMPRPEKPPRFRATITADGRWAALCPWCAGYHYHHPADRPREAKCLGGPWQYTGYIFELDDGLAMKFRGDNPHDLKVYGIKELMNLVELLDQELDTLPVAA